MKSTWRTLVLIVAVLFILLAAFLFWDRDSYPPCDTDLRFDKLQPRLVISAFDVFMPITNTVVGIHLMQEYKFYQRKRMTYENASLKEAVIPDEEFGETIERALRLANYSVTGTNDCSVRDEIYVHSLQFFLSSIFESYYTNGCIAEASQVCILMLNIGRMVQENASSLRIHSIGLMMVDNGVTHAQSLICDANTPSSVLDDLAEALSAIGTFESGFVRAIKTEYADVCGLINDIKLGEVRISEEFELRSYSGWVGAKCIDLAAQIPLFFQPNRTMNNIAQLCRSVILNASRSHADIDWAELTITEGSRDGLLFFDNRLALFFYGEACAYGAALNLLCRVRCNVAAARLMSVCAAYRQDHGNWPCDIRSLVPTYLNELPVDPYDGCSLRYTTNSFAVYSVGINYLDDHASTKQSFVERVDRGPAWRKWHAVDIVFPLNPSGLECGY